MNFNKHSDLAGKHAFLSASSYHWLNYDEQKLIDVYKSMRAKERGTILHDFASQCISLSQKLDDIPLTLNQYVNDSIGFKMTSEQPLMFSENCFGHADAISFRRKVLRIHDLKTGTTPANISQLRIYAALFCLEYKVKPHDISIILSIYQDGAVVMESADPNVIKEIMDKIVAFDKVIKRLKEEE